jgi:regulator of RNase E activity RraB
MGNRRVVDSLQESGDKLETPRKVDHWLYFNSSEMLQQFKERIKEEGFNIEDESGQKDEDGKYSLHISRTDAVDFHSINEVTDLLVELAEQFEGEYDG